MQGDFSLITMASWRYLDYVSNGNVLAYRMSLIENTCKYVCFARFISALILYKITWSIT